MLQQTRTETVIPYFERFITSVPDVQSLSEISDEALMKLWEGLGYYSRARNLKKAAILIMNQYQGVIPTCRDNLIKLPGIGDYSSGSIASIVYQEKTPAIDGNVLRVISRIFENFGNIMASWVKTEITSNVRDLLPDERIGDFNQALMELGASVCLGNGYPLCTKCPLSDLCLTHQHHHELQIPLKTRKKPVRVEKRTVFILEYRSRIAIVKRPEKGMLSGLWEFPSVSCHVSEEEAKAFLSERRIQSETIRKLPASEFQFTHLCWEMIGYFVHVTDNADNGLVWVTEEELKQYAIPIAYHTYKEQLKTAYKKQETIL
jgi:A/G-specific adenine glycosylase